MGLGEVTLGTAEVHRGRLEGGAVQLVYQGGSAFRERVEACIGEETIGLGTIPAGAGGRVGGQAFEHGGDCLPDRSVIGAAS